MQRTYRPAGQMGRPRVGVDETIATRRRNVWRGQRLSSLSAAPTAVMAPASPNSHG